MFQLSDTQKNRWRERKDIATILTPIILSLVLIAQMGSDFFSLWFSAHANLIMSSGMAVGTDYLSLWSGGWLALQDRAAEAYSEQAIFEAHRIAVPDNTATTLWFYPPTFLWVMRFFALLPYLPSLILFLSLGLTALLFVLWRIRPKATTLLFALASPALWFNLASGQNAFISAALLGGLVLSMQKRPFLSGMLIGLLTYKPHLGIPIPIALISSKQWKIILTAALSALLFIGISGLSLGADAWLAFIKNAALPLQIIANKQLPLENMTSIFAFAIAQDMPSWAALALQTLWAAFAALCVYAVWRKPHISFNIKAAMLGFACIASSPHAFNYDLTLALIPLAFWIKDVEKTKSYAGEAFAVMTLWLSPLIFQSDIDGIAGNPYPILNLLSFVMLLRRAARS